MPPLFSFSRDLSAIALHSFSHEAREFSSQTCASCCARGNCFLRELGSVGFGIVKDCLALALGVGAYGDGLLLGIAEKLLGSVLSLLDFAEYI